MSFLHLLDSVFLLMALASWITAGESRYRYNERIKEMTDHIELAKEQIIELTALSERMGEAALGLVQAKEAMEGFIQTLKESFNQPPE